MRESARGDIRAGPERVFSTAFVSLWVVSAAGLFGAHLLTPVMPLYVRAVGGNDAAVGVVGASLYVASLVARLLAAQVLVVASRKRVLVVSLLALVLVTLLYQVASGITTLLAVRVLHGLGAGFVMTAGVVIAADLIPVRRRAEGLGYYSLTNNLPQAVGPGIALFLIGAGGFALSGFPLLFAAATVCYVVGTLLSLPLKETGPHAAGTWRSLTRLRVRDFICRAALFPSIVTSALSFAYGTVVNFLPLAAADRGGNIGIFFLVYSGAVIATRPLSGRFADRFGRNTAAVPAIVAAVLGAVLLALEPAGATMIAGAVLLGSGMGAVWPAMMAEVVDRAPAAERGPALATLYVGGDVGMTVGAFVSGVVAQFAGYSAAFFLAGGIMAVALLGFLAKTRLARPAGKGQSA